MSSSESSTPDGTPQPCVLDPIFYVPDPAADDLQLASPAWIMATVIEDDDLMFGGKPLCDWYEEDRRRLSSCIDEEETRGRQRERARVETQHQQSQPHRRRQLHNNKPQQHQHHQHPSKKPNEAKD